MSKLAFLLADPERVADVEPAAVPELVGELETLRARLLLRLLSPTPHPAAPSATPTNGAGPDAMLTAEEAARVLGVSKRWLYRRALSLPFAKRLGLGTLRFSSRGLERWQARQ
ncbi:MAG TPA: helix-turn-helix domain-containing protein [Longimicrobiales bacterium]|nr:helix-turn-helix domain-containing protein [Longimicrobiales bacterium]